MRLFIVILSLIHCLAVDGATLRPAGSYPLQSLTHAVAVGDVNRDGKLDVITGDDSKSITVWLGDGKGGLTFRSRNSVGGKVQSVQAGDFNGDGNSDIVCAYHLDGIPTYIVAILLGNGDGTF